MKFTASQLALAAVYYFSRQEPAADYSLEELTEITEAVYDLQRLGDPTDLDLALEFIKFAFKGEQWAILEEKEDLNLLVGKALYWAN